VHAAFANIDRQAVWHLHSGWVTSTVLLLFQLDMGTDEGIEGKGSGCQILRNITAYISNMVVVFLQTTDVSTGKLSETQHHLICGERMPHHDPAYPTPTMLSSTKPSSTPLHPRISLGTVHRDMVLTPIASPHSGHLARSMGMPHICCTVRTLPHSWHLLTSIQPSTEPFLFLFLLFP
jgi:hypothetical protein